MTADSWEYRRTFAQPHISSFATNQPASHSRRWHRTCKGTGNVKTRLRPPEGQLFSRKTDGWRPFLLTGSACCTENGSLQTCPTLTFRPKSDDFGYGCSCINEYETRKEN